MKKPLLLTFNAGGVPSPLPKLWAISAIGIDYNRGMHRLVDFVGWVNCQSKDEAETFARDKWSKTFPSILLQSVNVMEIPKNITE